MGSEAVMTSAEACVVAGLWVQLLVLRQAACPMGRQGRGTLMSCPGPHACNTDCTAFVRFAYIHAVLSSVSGSLCEVAQFT